MYAFYFQIQFHNKRIYILRVHTNYVNFQAARSLAIEKAIEKWNCTRNDFTIEKVTLNSLLKLLSFKNDVAQFGEA